MKTQVVISKDQSKIHLIHWVSKSTQKGTILIIHGLGEHAGRYAHVAEYLNSKGYDVFAYDQRGHGRSEGQRAFAKSHEVFHNDLEHVIKHIENKLDDRFFVMGHSFGGNVLCSFMIERGHPRIKGLIFSSSWFKLAFDPPKIKVTLAKLLKGVWPKLSMKNEINTSDLSYDQATIDAYISDPLVHDKITAALFVNAYKAGLNCLEQADSIKIPVLIYHGEDDKIISSEGSKTLASKIKGSSLKIWEKTKHEPHNDIRKNEVIEFLGQWLDDQ